LADCLETNGNLIEKGNIQNSMKIINNISINVYNPSKAEGDLLENGAVISNNILNISGYYNYYIILFNKLILNDYFIET